MPRGEFFALISHFCQEKAEKMEMGAETREVISILEAEEGSATPNLSDRDGRNLRKTLARMNFSKLIGLALHRLGSPKDAEAAQRLSDALETWVPRRRFLFLDLAILFEEYRGICIDETSKILKA